MTLSRYTHSLAYFFLLDIKKNVSENLFKRHKKKQSWLTKGAIAGTLTQVENIYKKIMEKYMINISIISIIISIISIISIIISIISIIISIISIISIKMLLIPRDFERYAQKCY